MVSSRRGVISVIPGRRGWHFCDLKHTGVFLVWYQAQGRVIGVVLGRGGVSLVWSQAQGVSLVWSQAGPTYIKLYITYVQGHTRIFTITAAVVRHRVTGHRRCRVCGGACRFLGVLCRGCVLLPCVATVHVLELESKFAYLIRPTAAV